MSCSSRRPKGVLARLVEEVEEDSVARDEARKRHWRKLRIGNDTGDPLHPRFKSARSLSFDAAEIGIYRQIHSIVVALTFLRNRSLMRSTVWGGWLVAH